MSYDPSQAAAELGESLLSQHLVMAQNRLFKRWHTWADQQTEMLLSETATPHPFFALTTTLIGLASSR